MYSIICLYLKISWSGTNENFNFQNAPVCMIHRAGELSLIEYGINSVLASVRNQYYFNNFILIMKYLYFNTFR